MNIPTIYSPIDSEVCGKYMRSLIGKVYKILPLFEEECPTVRDYIASLLRELTGMKELFISIDNDPGLVSVLCTLEYLRTAPYDANHRKEIFKCINIIKSLNQKYFAGDGND